MTKRDKSTKMNDNLYCQYHKKNHQMKDLDLSKIHKLCIAHGHCIVGPVCCPLSHTCIS